MSLDERLLIDGKRLDADVTDRVTSAKLLHTMEGASSVVLTVDDHDFRLLRSGALARPGKPNRRAAKIAAFNQAAWDRFGAARLTLDGAFFRLAGVSGSYDAQQGSLTITFEDEIAAFMRQATDPIKSSRGIMTRAEAMHWAARRAMRRAHVHFGFFSPQEGQRQPIAAPDKEQAKKGIHRDKHFTIKGEAPNDEQRRNVETALAVADDENAGDRATLAMLVAAIGESEFLTIPNTAGSDYGGVWQGKYKGSPLEGGFLWKISDVKGMARSFLRGGKGFQAGGAISYAAKNPDATAGTIAYKVEGDRSNFGSDAQAETFYQQHLDEATAMLDARGGVSQIHVIRERFEYSYGGRKDGKKRNYWDDSGTSADEVRWRRFASENTLWFVDDAWLFERKPMYMLTPDSDGVNGISFEADVGMPVAEITLDARAARWTTPPGAVYDLDGLGPLDGRWLCWTSEQDLLTEQVDITLHRPAPARKEPAPGTHTVTTSETTPESGSVRAAIIAAARKARKQSALYRYRQVRPMPKTLFPKQHGLVENFEDAFVYIDCSAFVTLAYKAAGAPDPNGRGYDGSGYTGTLWAHGTLTTDPQPGDLCFYGDPAATNSHVNLYLGDGKAMNMGPSAGLSGPIPVKSVRSDFKGYRTYDVEATT